MRHLFPTMLTISAAICTCCLLTACGGGDAEATDQPVTIAVAGPNAVSYWNEVATTTINAPATTTGTAEEQRPNTSADLATVHVAIYDAVMAIAGTHQPYAITPKTSAAGASQEAAVAAAAYGVLSGLFPNRSAQYHSAYASFIATLPADAARAQGLAVGAEVAAGILTLRADDGRSVALDPFVPGTAPGEFRGSNPIGRPNAYIKPFALTTIAQFRAPGPPALTNSTYAADFNETKAFGSASSIIRTAEQTEIARFHTEAPPNFWPRNMRNFAMTSRSIAEQARLTAMIWVTHADAGNACFESKYYYKFWRPASAITLAGTDSNDATVADPAWTTVVPTPNHPEYPAAHGCLAGAMSVVLRNYYATPNLTFEFTSTVTGTTHRYATTSSLVDEIQVARIAGGMHFRSALVDGAALGTNVANWVVSHKFQPR